MTLIAIGHVGCDKSRILAYSSLAIITHVCNIAPQTALIGGICSLRKRGTTVIFFFKMSRWHIECFQTVENFEYLIFESNTNSKNIMFDEHSQQSNIHTPVQFLSVTGLLRS